jgi:hypothetical protein
MSSPTSISDLDGLFKIVYGSQIINLMPEASKIVRMIPFSQEERIGKRFDQPVALTYEHGFTYGAPGAGAFSLRASISMKMQNAEVDGYQGVLRAQMDYETAAKAVAGGAKAFKKATQLQVENMMESGTKRVELACLYGQVGLGKTASSVNTDATTTVLQVTTATWATGIWSGMENCPLNFFAANGSLISSGADAIFYVQSVDVDNRKITVTGTITGITALDIAAGSGALDIYFDTARTGASAWNEMVGIDKIITNTTTLFNIDAGTYNLWKGNTYSNSGAALTLGKIISAIALPVGRGLNEKVVVFLNDRTWANVASDQAALRKYDASYSAEEIKNGARAIRFYSQNGEIELQPYNCVKEGEAFAIPTKRFKRIGAQDISFNSLGVEGRIFRELTDNAGFEYRLYTDQSIFCETPAKCLKITNIVNS